MALIAEDAFFKLSDSARAAANGVLLYGTDENQVSACLRRIVTSWKGDEEPLQLTGSALRSDPALLESAFRGMSLFGGRRLIVVEGVDENHTALLAPVMGTEEVANYVVLCAGSLNKGSALRTGAESARRFHVIAFHEETESEFSARADRLLRAAGLAPELDAVGRLVELSGGVRGVLEGEVSKLALYLGDGARVTQADVEELCGNASDFDAATLIGSVMGGDFVDVELQLSAARSSDETEQILNAVKWQVDRLLSVRVAYEQTGNWEQAFSRMRPPVHFKIKDRWKTLLSAVSSTQLEALDVRLSETILAGRRLPQVSGAMAERFVLAAARDMRSARR